MPSGRRWTRCSRTPRTHSLGCHRPRVSDRMCLRAMLVRLVTGCSWVDAEWLIDSAVFATTLRARRDEWAHAGAFGQIAAEALAALWPLLKWRWLGRGATQLDSRTVLCYREMTAVTEITLEALMNQLLSSVERLASAPDVQLAWLDESSYPLDELFENFDDLFVVSTPRLIEGHVLDVDMTCLHDLHEYVSRPSSWVANDEALRTSEEWVQTRQKAVRTLDSLRRPLDHKG
jgi:hypothetical protein